MEIVIFGYLLGDFMSGLFHWWEDRYGNPSWPLLGKYIVQPNIEHHKHPRDLCKRTYVYRVGNAVIATLPLIIIAIYFQYYILAFGFVVLSQANEIHTWAHMRKNTCIRFLQSVGILLSPRQHHEHHKQPYSEYYCVITNYLNPVLTYIRFWRGLEWVVACVGIPVNSDRAKE